MGVMAVLPVVYAEQASAVTASPVEAVVDATGSLLIGTALAQPLVALFSGYVAQSVRFMSAILIHHYIQRKR